MATEQEIKTLLDGRKIVDAYVLAKTDRSDPHWVHPSIPELIKALGELKFESIDAFFLYDAKLSYQEIADVIDMVSPLGDTIKTPMCDNCADRLPAGCNEVMRIIQGSTPTCRDDRGDMTVATADSFYANKPAAQILPGGDPVYAAYKAEATRLAITKCMLGTLDDVVLFWNFPGHFPPKCTITIKLKRELAFDPFWKLGIRSYPYIDITRTP